MNKEEQQLGLKVGTAFHRLRKIVIFELVKETGRDTCFRCGLKIISAAEISLEHKIPWRDADDPKEMFFGWGNIGFSHLSCNSRHSRRPHKKFFTKEEKRASQARHSRKHRANHYNPLARHEKYLRRGT